MIGNAELQKAPNWTVQIVCSRTIYDHFQNNGELQNNRSMASSMSKKQTFVVIVVDKKTQRNFQQKGANALVTKHSEGAEYYESYISEETI